MDDGWFPEECANVREHIDLKTANFNSTEMLPSSTDGTINIDGDTALDTFCAGNGTDGLSWSTAHVIKDLTIISGDDEYCIFLGNTTRFLVIQNCTLEGPGSGGVCISLDSCTNINISRNVIRNNHNGIYLDSSEHVTVDNNTIRYHDEGIHLYRSYNNTIKYNEIGNSLFSGIFLFDSIHNVIIYNTIYETWSPINPEGTDNDIHDNEFLDIFNDYVVARIFILIIYVIVVGVSIATFLIITSSKKARLILEKITNPLLKGNSNVRVLLAGIISCCMNPAIWSIACMFYSCSIPLATPLYSALCLASAILSTFTIFYAITSKRHHKIDPVALCFAIILSIVSIVSILPPLRM